MKSERWKEIDELLSAVLERAPDDRTAFLAAACPGDDDLRREVESLLAADARDSGFIGAPGVKIADHLLDETGNLKAGEQIGRFKIVSLIGRGGMGTVYLAEDKTLGRRVALKLLRPAFIRREDRLRRFEQEARAASALNHPSILVIHEVGSEGDLHFIISEFVEGETLRDRISRSRMTIGEAVDVAVQVASALSAAHQAGIVHRDIKPENVMLRADGLAKVLDFGLAKLTEQPASPIGGEASTLAQLDTEPGTILGTVNYMSPEQARGQQVDARSDIFSLGVMIHEMISGRLPFDGETRTDVLASILNAQPAPLTRYSPEAPEESQRIVSKTLAKDRERRYQTSKDLLVDLKNLRHKLEFQSELERSAATDGRATAANTNAETRTTSSAAFFWSAVTRHKAGAALLVAASIVAAAALVYFNRGSPEKAIDSLAILPFVNASNDPNADYLGDGIAETLINSFSQLPRLKVTARTTAFRYKSKDVDTQQAGRELNVQAVLTGKVIQQRDNLIVQVDLIDVANGTQIWGDRYSRKLSDLLTVQNEIARSITDRLRLKLTGEEERKLTKKYTDNAEAYEAYLLGRYWLAKRSEEGFKNAVDAFNRAIANDADYALAYSGLADCYTILGSNLRLPMKEAQRRAREAAMRALDIDSQLPEAHASLGCIMSIFEWNWSDAERELNRALELNPNYATAHLWYAQLLSITGRHQEALVEAKRALELEPFSSIGRRDLGIVLCLSGKYDQAIDQLKASIEMERDAIAAWGWLHLAYEANGMFEAALKVTQEQLRSHPNNYAAIALLARDYARLGKKKEAKKTLSLLESQPEQQTNYASFKATAYEAMGDYDKAFELFQQACEQRESAMAYLKVSPTLSDRLRADPRFRELLRCVGLAE